MNEKLEQIKAALRHALELDAKATHGRWRIGSDLSDRATIYGPIGRLAVAAGGEVSRSEHNAAFIAHARTYHPAAARALLTAIAALENEATRYFGAMKNTPEDALSAICRDWLEDAL